MFHKFYFLNTLTRAGLFAWLMASSIEAFALENEKGPFLNKLLDRARQLNLQYSSDPEDLSTAPWETARVFITDSADNIVLTFDYQGEYFPVSSYYREHMLNIKGTNAQLVRELVQEALPNAKKNSADMRIFLRSISQSLIQNFLLGMDLISFVDSANEPITAKQWVSRLYLMAKGSRENQVIQFLPAEVANIPEESDQHLPLISLELSHSGSQSSLHYLRYLVPAQTGGSGADVHFGIDMRAASDSLNQYRRFAVGIDVGDRTTTILPSIYDGREIISEIALEIYALSSYIQGFLDWFTPIWFAEFPKAETIRMKRQFSDRKYLKLNLYQYRAHLCANTVTKHSISP